MAKSVWSLTKPWAAQRAPALLRPCHCYNDSHSCHYQEEEKLKLGCESANGTKQKNRKLREDSCELWVTPPPRPPGWTTGEEEPEGGVSRTSTKYWGRQGACLRRSLSMLTSRDQMNSFTALTFLLWRWRSRHGVLHLHGAGLTCWLSRITGLTC